MSNQPTALLSVSDKSGISEFASQLLEQGYTLLSTGGTFRLLRDAGLTVSEVSDYTGFKEMMDGRVKTLHPKIHGGILGRRGQDDQVMQDNQINPIDIVVVNLYPFAETVADANVTMTDAIENIDIGGPTMVRAAAKNHEHVTIVTNPQDYDLIIDALASADGITASLRYDLAVKAFEHTAHYDGMIANFLGGRLQESSTTAMFPRTFNQQFCHQQTLRYGENPHQQAALYVEHNVTEASVATAKQVQGKALSYNNIADTDAALECVKSFSQPACVIVKHANPCGVAVRSDLLTAYQTAFATDPESSFGGIIAFNRPLTTAVAEAIVANQFVEVIIAPAIEDGVLKITGKKKNVRVLVCGQLPDPYQRQPQLDYKRITGGLLVQEQDLAFINGNLKNEKNADQAHQAKLEIVTDIQPSEKQMIDLLFTWRVAKYVKSNAIVYGKDQRTIGIGAGQMSRVNSARIAAIKAEHANLSTQSAVMASDAFFPFRDGIDNAAAVGIKAIIQPGGSIRDEETIAAANEHGIAMVFTGMRHFRH